MRAAAFVGLFIILQMSEVWCHYPSYASTPANKIEQFCTLAQTCVHDTIPICGTKGDIKRTFLDLCDLLEYTCDSNEIYTHVDDIVGCPEHKTLDNKKS